LESIESSIKKIKEPEQTNWTELPFRMFKLFSKNNDLKCPIDHEMRLWMENAFLWLATQFGKINVYIIIT